MIFFYFNFWRQKLEVLIYHEVKINRFIVISLIKQALFLVTPIDIGIKLLNDQSDRLW